MARLLRRLVIAAGIAVILLTGASVPGSAAGSESQDVTAAQGADTVSPAGDPSTNACGVDTESGDQATNYLPIERWSASTGLFPINPERGAFDISTMIQESSTQMFGGTLFGVSSSIWQLNVTAADIGMRFCPLEHMGYYIDDLVGTFGEVLLDSGGALLVALLVMTIVVVIWQGRRSGRFDIGTILGKTAAIAVLAVMVAGAAQSTGGDGDDYEPVWYSPGGVISTMNNVTTTLGTGVVESTMDAVSENISSTTDFGDRHPPHCQNMIDAGHEAYAHEAGGGGSMVGGLSQTWASTVYASWTRALLGDDFSPSEGASGHGYIPCRLAEWNSSMPLVPGDDEDQSIDDAWDRSSFLALGFAYGQSDDGSLGLQDAETGGQDSVGPYMVASQMRDDDGGFPWTRDEASEPTAPIIHTDRSQQMYAALASGVCYQTDFSDGAEPHGSLNPEFNGVFEGNSLANMGNEDNPREICDSLYRNTDGEDNNPLLAGGYPVHGTGSAIRDDIHSSDGATPSPAGMTSLIAFMVSDNMFGSISEGSASAITSVSVMLILVPVMVVLMLVRLLMVMMILGLVLSLIAGLLPGRSFEPLMRMLKMTVGVVLVSMFVQVIFALIMTLMLMLNDLGAQVVDPGTVSFALWAAITPWLAVLGLHLVFKFLKIPSPLKLSSAMEWGNALSKQGADSIGSKVGASAGSAEDKAKSMGRRLAGSSVSGSPEGVGAERQRGDQQTRDRIGSQRGADAEAAQQESGSAEQGSETSAPRGDVAGAKDRVGSAKDAAKRAVSQKRSEHRAERKQQRAQQKEDRQAAEAQWRQRGDSEETVSRRRKSMATQQASERATASQQQARQRQDAQSSYDGAVSAARDGVSTARSQRRADRIEDRRARKSALRDARAAERASRGLTRREGESKTRYAARRLGQGSFRALSATNATEGLSKAQMASRAAKVGAGVAGVNALAGLGGAPIAAAAAGTALGGLGAAGARRMLNSATSTNSGSLRERASVAAHQRGMPNTLGSDRIGAAVSDYSDRSGQGLDRDQTQPEPQQQPDTAPETGGDDHRDFEDGTPESDRLETGASAETPDQSQGQPQSAEATNGRANRDQAGEGASHGPGRTPGTDPAEDPRPDRSRSGASDARSEAGDGTAGSQQRSTPVSGRTQAADRVGAHDVREGHTPDAEQGAAPAGHGNGRQSSAQADTASGGDRSQSSPAESRGAEGATSEADAGVSDTGQSTRSPDGGAPESQSDGGRRSEDPSAAQSIDPAEDEPTQRTDRIGQRRR